MTADFEPISIDLAREPDFVVGALRVRPSLRQVESAGGSETLEPRVMQVLVALFQRRGEVVSRDELTRRCWGGRVVGEDAISRAIARVRKLGEAQGAFTLETIPRVGYRLVAHGAVLAPAVAPPVVDSGKPEAAPPAPGPAARLFGLQGWQVITGAGVLLAILLATALYFGIRNSQQVVVRTPDLVAVLPFADDGVPGAVALARAAPKAIVDALSRNGMPSVLVSAREVPPGESRAQTASRLHAGYLVDGDVALSGGRLATVARIYDQDGLVLGNRSVKPAMDSAGKAPEQIGSSLAIAFVWLLSTSERSAVTAEQKITLLQGANATVNGDSVLAFSNSRRQLEAQPNDGFALAGYVINGARALSSVPLQGRKALLADLREKSAAGLKVTPMFKHAYLAASQVLPEADIGGRENLIRRTFERDPAERSGQAFLALVLSSAGLNRDAKPYIVQGSMDRSSVKKAQLIRQHLAMGARDEAMAVAKATADINGGDPPVQRALFDAMLWMGDRDEARAMLDDPELLDQIDRPVVSRPARPLVAALMSGAAKDRQAFTAACARYADLSKDGVRFCLLGLAEFGEADAAFRLLESALPDQRGASPEARDERWLAAPDITDTRILLFWPQLRALRRDDRMRDVFERSGLVDYWRTTGKWPDCADEPKSMCALLKAGG